MLDEREDQEEAVAEVVGDNEVIWAETEAVTVAIEADTDAVVDTTMVWIEEVMAVDLKAADDTTTSMTGRR